MTNCEECGKKLGILGGYRHPTLGKNYFLCKSCYISVNESVVKYREFLQPYFGFFKKEPQEADFQQFVKNIKENVHPIRNNINALISNYLKP
jgi:hypothetical protein